MTVGDLLRDDEDRALARHFPRGRELVVIALFWTVFGALSVTNWLFPPGDDGPPITLPMIVSSAFSPVLWLIATPPLFWLTSRFSVEREGTGNGGTRRVPTVLFYLAVGLLVAFTVDALGELVRGTFGPPRRFPGAGGPRGPGGSHDHPFWGLTRGRLLNEYVLCVAIIAVGVARDYFVRYHRRLEESIRLRAQLAEARLTVLQSQLNPHFLFNTLNAVSALVERDPRGVRRMIARLSELLRATLEPSTDPEVPVSREIEILERYLEILRIRFEGRLETSITAPPDVRDALVPPMILQPLVENAMKHAVSKTSAASRIDVSIVRQGGMLALTVSDTGPGDNNSTDAGPIQETGMGIGLRNTRARLEEIYDDDSSLDLVRTPHGGASATIRLPFHTSRDLRATPAAGGVR